MNNEQLGISQLEANLNKGWGWDEWQEKAPEGIEAMAKYKPEIFNVLYKAKYGVAPSMSASNGDLPSASIMGAAQLEANLNKDWGWDEWQEKAPEGIEAMAKYKPEIFNVLYKAKYGVAPSMSGSNGDLSSASIMGAAQLEANLNKGWGWDEWQEKAPEGIEAMAKYKPEIFNALYKAKYGVVITA